jgi:hypothetical protein
MTAAKTLPSKKLLPPIPLRIEQGGEFAVIGPRRCAIASDTTLKFDFNHGA